MADQRCITLERKISGTLNIFPYVVDGAISEAIIIDCLKENGHLDGSLIARRERAGDENYYVFWPKNLAGKFRLIL